MIIKKDGILRFRTADLLVFFTCSMILNNHCDFRENEMAAWKIFCLESTIALLGFVIESLSGAAGAEIGFCRTNSGVVQTKPKLESLHINMLRFEMFLY